MATAAGITSTLLDLPDLVIEKILGECHPLDLIRLWQIEGFRDFITEKELMIITHKNNRHKYGLPDSFFLSLSEAYPLQGNSTVGSCERIKKFRGTLVVENTYEDYQDCFDEEYNHVKRHVIDIMELSHTSTYFVINDINEWYNFSNSFASRKITLENIKSISVPCLESITRLPCFHLDPKIFQLPNVNEIDWSMNYNEKLNDLITMCPSLKTLRLSGGPSGAYDFNDADFVSTIADMINGLSILPQEVIISNFHGLVGQALLQSFPFTSKLESFVIDHCSNIQIEQLSCYCKNIKLIDSKISKINDLNIPLCSKLEITNCSIETISNIIAKELEILNIKLTSESTFTLQHINAPRLTSFQLNTLSNPGLAIKTSDLPFPILKYSDIRTTPRVTRRRSSSSSSTHNHFEALRI